MVQQISFESTTSLARLRAAAAAALSLAFCGTAFAGAPALTVETKIASVDGDAAYQYPGFGDSGLMVVKVFVENLLPGDAVTSVFGDVNSPATIRTSAASFFNQNHANASAQPNPGMFETTPQLQWDTFLAIDDAPLFLIVPLDLNIALATGGNSIIDHDNMAWIASPPGVGSVTATGTVLIGQFAFAEGSEFEINVSISIKREGVAMEFRDLSYTFTPPEPTGACCVDGKCFEVTEEVCTLLGQVTGSTYHGDGTTCGDIDCSVAPPVTGACCVANVCSEMTAELCTLAGGTFSGAGTLCANVQCGAPQTGACCIAGVCGEMAEAACTLAGGTFSGAGTLCADVQCDAEPKTGACCVEGKCVEVTEDVCTLMGQVATTVFHGVGSTCSEVDCSNSPPTTGACCIMGLCQEMTQEVCALAGGTFEGVGTLCANVDCTNDPPPTTGACCIMGICQEMSEELCALSRGVFAGVGTSCLGEACVVPQFGACCIDLQCMQRTEQGCLNAGGVFHGVGTPCSQVDCDPGPPVGGCCVNRDCIIALEETCEMLGGTFYGVGVPCLNRVCAQTERAKGSGCMAQYYRMSQTRQNDFAHWPAQYSPQTQLDAVFTISQCLTDQDFQQDSLRSALSYHMGAGLNGAAKAMYSEAVAALLNAQKTQNGDCDLNYPFADPQQVIELTNYVAGTCDRNLIRELAQMFAAYNRLGCPCRFTTPPGQGRR